MKKVFSCTCRHTHMITINNKTPRKLTSRRISLLKVGKGGKIWEKNCVSYLTATASPTTSFMQLSNTGLNITKVLVIPKWDYCSGICLQATSGISLMIFLNHFLKSVYLVIIGILQDDASDPKLIKEINMPENSSYFLLSCSHQRVACKII